MGTISTAMQISEAISNLISNLEYVASKKIQVGIPQGKDKARTDENGNETVTNAQLLYFHEMGAPSANIPPKDVVLDALTSEEFKQSLTASYKDAIMCAVLGNRSGVDSKLQQIGQNAVQAVKSSIQEKGLVDTGQMRDSIDYIIK